MKRRKTKTWKVVAAIVAALVAVLVAAFYIGVGPLDFAPRSRDVDSAAIAFRQSGWPWTAAEVDPRGVPSAQDDAVPLLEEALRDIDKKESDVEKELSKKIENDDYSHFQPLFSSLSQPMSMAADATRRPRVNFRHDWDYGPQILFPEFANEKLLIKLFAFRADLEASTHDIEGACRDLGVAWKLCDFAGQEPLLIGMLVEVAGHAIVANAYDQCAAFCASDAHSLAELSASFQPGPELDFVSHLRFEAYNSLAILRNLDHYGGLFSFLKWATASGSGEEDGDTGFHFNPVGLRRSGLPTDLLSRAFLDHSLRYWATFGPNVEKSTSPEAISSQMEQSMDRATKTPSWSGALDEILLPVFTQAGMTIIKDQASQRTTEALMQAMIIRAKTGHFPARIEDIPGKWIDPFTGEPLKLKNVEGSFRIYSVGPDRIDNGGRTRNEVQKLAGLDQYDIVAAYPPIR